MKIEKGCTVSMDYEGRLENGEVFDSSSHGDHNHPLDFTVGNGQVIPGFEKAVMGMEKGQEKEFSIAPEEAYGKHDPTLQKDFPRSALPQGQEPKVGMALYASAPDGRQFPLRITAVNKDSVTLDLNHPLAGKTLIFKIKIVDVQKK